jgi:sugar phosphate isomerase/epimerase
VKLSVFTVSTPDVTPEQLIMMAKKTGLQGIEWRYKETASELLNQSPSYWGNNKCTLDPNATDEVLKQLAQEVKNQGMSTIALTPYLTAGDLKATEHAMRHASLLGASMMRVGVPKYDRQENYNEAFSRAKVYLKEVESLSRKYGIKGLVETHHETITPSASLAQRLVHSFDPNHIGVLYDPGNMIHEGYENYRMGLELLGDYLAHVHVKNAGWYLDEAKEGRTWSCKWEGLERGIVDWKQVLSDLKAVGYDGWFGVEDFSGTRSTGDMLSFYADWFRDLIQDSKEGDKV